MHSKNMTSVKCLIRVTFLLLAQVFVSTNPGLAFMKLNYNSHNYDHCMSRDMNDQLSFPDWYFH